MVDAVVIANATTIGMNWLIQCSEKKIVFIGGGAFSFLDLLDWFRRQNVFLPKQFQKSRSIFKMDLDL